MVKKILCCVGTLLLSAVSLAALGVLVLSLALSSGATTGPANAEPVNVAILDRYDMQVTNAVSTALEGVMAIEKVYWLSDHDLTAPKPNQACYGTADDPAQVLPVLEQAQKLLNGQQTLFSTQIQLAPDTHITYYLDETIFAVAWKQAINGTMYSVCEVKLAHPSQFRRFLSGGQYGSQIQLLTTEMAESVNAVVASSGDFYAFRRMGVVVYDGTVQRVNSESVDTCYIDDQGDLLFTYRGQLPDMASAQAFVDEHAVRFSLAFGPVLVDGGQCTDFSGYVLGEVTGSYARAALCQMDSLHYLLVTASKEGALCRTAPTLHAFQQQIAAFGCDKAYALDGGQTAAIVMNGQLINRVVYGYQRSISDIIYFATAIPDGE